MNFRFQILRPPAEKSEDQKRLKIVIDLGKVVHIAIKLYSPTLPRSSKQGMGFIISVEILILYLSYSCLKFSIAGDAITLNQTIIDSGTIISREGAFQLGFFSPANTTNRYVGIWYNKIPAKTVIWVANRDRPLNDSSGTFRISEDGNLVVLNGQREIIWSSNVSNSAANSSAQLLDSGNLVLRGDSSGKTMWESFDKPSDSFIERMKLTSYAGAEGKNAVLKSWKSSSDPSTGSFTAGLNTLNIPQIFVWNGSRPHWRSGPWNGQIFIGVQYMNSVYLNGFDYVDNKDGTAYLILTIANDSTLAYFVLNHNGSLLQKEWFDEKQDWMVTWSFPGAECDIYGKCGPFGSCDPKSSPICSCLRGFAPKHEEEWNGGNFSSGCVRTTLLQCERNSNSSREIKKDGFVKMTTMKVPDYAGWYLARDDECENQCLGKCSCTAYAYNEGIGCMLWTGNLIDLQKFSSDGTDLYIRVAYSELDKKRNMKVIIAIPVITGSIIAAICAYFLWIWLVKRRGMKESEMFLFKKLSRSPDHSSETGYEDKMSQVKLEELPLLKIEKLAIATNNFDVSNKLGQGGFGHVYKGKLPDGQEIAVKRLSRSSGQGLEEFMNEVVLISKLQHRNLVRLLGCCVEGDEKMLIYEYLANKSLDAILFDCHKQLLQDWNKRFHIIVGIGRGLLYLHRDSRLKIIHRDLKASNVLLDKELNPKISDFGMARIFRGNEDQANTRRIMGTYGYMAPEYAMDGRFSEKSDVFSFGILLLEIVSGKRNTSFYDDEQSLSLVSNAWKLWCEDNIVALIDPRLSYQEFLPEILRCIHVGFLCVQEFAKDRPTISIVLSMLSSEIAHLPMPKQPAFTQKPASTGTGPSQQSRSRHSINDCSITIVEGR